MPGPHRRCFLALAALLLFAGAAPTSPPAEKPSADEITLDAVKVRIKQTDDSPEIEEPVKAKVKDLYQQATRELESAKTWKSKAEFFEKSTVSAQPDLKKTRDGLASLPAQATVTIPGNITLPDFAPEIAKKEAALGEGRNELAKLEAEPKRRAAQRVEIPKAIAAAKDRLADLEKQLKAPPPPEEAAPLTAARRVLLQARKQTAEVEIAACEKEITFYEATAELLSIRRDLAARQVALAEQELKQWREAMNQHREREAERQIARARIEATLAHPAVRKLAQDNAELAEMRRGIAERIAETARQLEEVQQRLTLLKDQFKRLQEKVEAVGRSNAIGLLLRKQREALPNLAQVRRNSSSRQAAIREGQLALFQLQDRRSELANLDLRVRTVLQNLPPEDRKGDLGEMESAVRESLKTEKEYLDGLISDHNSYFDKLVDLENAERQLIREAEACGRYIDERVLWTGSAAPLGLSDLHAAGDALRWLARPEGWMELGQALAADARANPVPPALALLALALLVRWRGRLRLRMEEIGDHAAKAGCYRFLPTLETLLLTLLMPVVVPGILWYLSWRLCAELDSSEWCKAVGGGLAAMAKVYLVFELLRQVCREKGLGEAHFGWKAAGLKALRGQIQWFLIGSLPLAFLSAAMRAQDSDRWRDSLGRLSFIGGAVLFSLFLQRALRPNGSVFEALLDTRRGGWLDRLRYVWYPLVVLHPLVLAAMAGTGYTYTSQHLARRIFTTIYLLLGLMLLRGVLMRWTLVNRRKLAIQQARNRRPAAQGEGTAGEVAGGELPPKADPTRDLATINNQTRRLIEYSMTLACIVAVWFAWIDVLPALKILDRVQLWHVVVNATETVRAPDGTTTLNTVTKLSAVTLADLGLAVLVLATTWIAVRNLPGLLEMGLLQHLPLDPGLRYAVGAISRYVITIVGIVLASSTIGLSWSRVQWLVAAVGVGLGFGLQEIFANFVSGLIILFERPVRVGDVVTMDGSSGNITGVISRIRMRATTITDGDHKELIIPNKEFITGRVLNWTLTDQINRVVIKVGINYGSDTQQVSELLLKVASQHPHVLADPPPTVSLEEFTPNALGFVLRCFLPDLDTRLKAIHDLHVAIDHELHAAGIQIAYPQQALHVRSINIGPEVLRAIGDKEPPRLHLAGEEDDVGQVSTLPADSRKRRPA